ncbi:calphotin-like [Procambarus clarkii]|uniref:calphotin-like n=1 Tax=Procambarus clarkii TaxID=6728 RepID=UPI003742837A
MEFPEGLLRRYFGQFGAVVSVRLHMISSSPLKGVRTNIRTLGMRLWADIPSSVKFLGYHVRVFYARQPRTCYHCGLLGHQAAGCSAPAVAPVNLFSEEDFPPLPVGEASVDVDVSLAAAVPPVSTVAPPVVVASPPEVVSTPGDRPAPAGVPVLQTAFCSDPPSSSSSSVPVPAPSPSVPAVVGAGVDTAPPVPGLVPHVVEDAAVPRRASVHPACVARVSESASGSDDVRPEPKRSRRSSTACADVGDFDDCGSYGGVPLVALHSTVVAEMHLPEDGGAGVSASPSGVVSADPDLGASDGSGSSWVVPPAEARGERGDLVVVLKKAARSEGSVPPSSFPVSSAAVSTPLPSQAASSVSPAVSVEVLPSCQPSPFPVRSAARPSRRPMYASSVSSASSEGVFRAPLPRYAAGVAVSA